MHSEGSANGKRKGFDQRHSSKAPHLLPPYTIGLGCDRDQALPGLMPGATWGDADLRENGGATGSVVGTLSALDPDAAAAHSVTRPQAFASRPGYRLVVAKVSLLGYEQARNRVAKVRQADERGFRVYRRSRWR